MVSIENIFAAGAAVLAGRQLGAKDENGASRTVTSVIGLSILIGVVLCVGGIAIMEPLLRAFVHRTHRCRWRRITPSGCSLRRWPTCPRRA